MEAVNASSEGADSSLAPFFYLISPDDSEEAFLVQLSVTLFLFLISFVFNLINVCSVWCPTTLQSYGYFHSLAVFGLVHFCYFLVKTFGFLDARYDGKVDGIAFPEFYTSFDKDYGVSEFMATYKIDIEMCLVGLCMFLLAAMVMDALTITCCRTRRGCVKCCRFFYVLCALAGAAVIYLFVLVINLDLWHLRSDAFGEGQPSPELASILVYGVYLTAFVFFPSFVIVIFGTVNWVSDVHSSRPISHPKRTVRTLDHKLLILSIFVLLFLLVALILRFSLDLSVFEPSTEDLLLTQWANFALWLCFDVLFGLYPAVFLCQLGKYCCCSCCCDEEPFDDYVEEM